MAINKVHYSNLLAKGKSIKSVVLVNCQDTMKYHIPGYFLNTEYQNEKCHTARQ